MANITLTFSHLDENNFPVLLEEMGTQWVARIIKYFDIGGPPEDKWAPTQNPQKAALLKKIEKEGLSIKTAMLNKYFDEQRKPLKDTDALMNSFTYNVKVVEKYKYELQVGTNVAYAEKHHFGQDESIEITDTMKQAIKQITKRGDKKFGFLRQFITKKSYDFKLHKRTLIMWDSVLREQIENIWRDFVSNTNREAKGAK